MRTKAPSDVVEYIRSKFQLIRDEVTYKKNENPPFGTSAKFNGNTYSKSYVKDVLEGRDPDLSVLFDEKDGALFRNNDPVWSTRKGNEVTKSGTIVCGVKVLSDRTIVGKPVAKVKEASTDSGASTDYYKAIEVPKHIKRLIQHKFKLRNGVVVYKHKTTDSGNPKLLENTHLAGHRYSASYVLAVLKGEKPNLETLFTIQDGCRVRNNDPVWMDYKNTKSSKSFYSTCGETVPVKMTAPAIPRADDFAWLAEMVPQGKLFSYKGETKKAYWINGVIYSTGFIRETLAGKEFTQEDRPPIPAYLYKRVRLDFGDGSFVTMTSDDEDFWPKNSKLLEIRDNKEYMINGFMYSGEEIIRQVSRDSSCRWSWEHFYQVARDLYPDDELVANIKLDDSEFTGEM